MLFWQGVLKFEIYTGVKPPVEVMEKALHHL
jgi:shikimate 5-dehydrogenase